MFNTVLERSPVLIVHFFCFFDRFSAVRFTNGVVDFFFAPPPLFFNSSLRLNSLVTFIRAPLAMFSYDGTVFDKRSTDMECESRRRENNIHLCKFEGFCFFIYIIQSFEQLDFCVLAAM